jgi:hypothetical protein
VGRPAQEAPRAPVDLELLERELGLEAGVLQAARQAGGVFDGSPTEAAEAMVVWIDDPVQYVRDVFGAEPDDWQRDALYSYRDNDRTALVACKGPGKTTAEAWCGWWSLSLWAHANGIAISITQDNLKDNLWKELAVWYARSPWLQWSFDFKKQRIIAYEAPDTWWLSARAFSQDARPDQQANTLAGLHSQTHVFILCDESSDYPPGVMPAAEGIFTNRGVGGIVARLLQAGNPTRSEGPLYDAAVTHRRRWNVIHITGDPADPKRSPRIDLEYAQSLIDEYGRDDAFVMVNILGQFPKSGSDKLLGPADVQAAVERAVHPREFARDAKVMGVDVASVGTAKSVATLRQGSYVIGSRAWRIEDTHELADQIALLVSERDPDRVFIDVGGVGRGVYDRLRHLGLERVLVAVDFGGQASDPTRWYDKRSEMWCRMADAVKKWLAIPDSPGLRADLLAPRKQLEVKGKHTVLKLESKKEMSRRGIPSPDDGDALALTFANPVQPRPRDAAEAAEARERHQTVHQYNPYDRRRRAGRQEAR